jgi:hypothetical protein
MSNNSNNSFYLTLPSNSSMSHYPENTVAQYKTKLYNTIELDGDWEIGLCEVEFPKSWFTIPKDGAVIIIECNGCAAEARRGIYDNDPPPEIESNEAHAGSTEGEKEDPHSKKILPTEQDMIIKVIIPGGYYEDVPDVIRTLNMLISKEFMETSQYIYNDLFFLPPKLKQNLVTRKVQILIPKNYELTLPPSLLSILGFTNEQLPLRNQNGEHKEIIAQNVADISAGITNVYIYCDLVDFVHVGDTLSPLLRIVNASGENGEIVHTIFEQPRYLPVRRKNFDVLDINIRDSFGDIIAFQNGQTTVTLHLRRSETINYFKNA